jgi:ABC-2 type transport system permease protein
MAVYRQIYKPYRDRLTPPSGRFWVLTRFAFREVFASKLVLIFFVLSFVPMLGGGSIIYLRNNLEALLTLQIPPEAFFAIDATFFATLMGVQSTLAFFIAALVGPGLVSPDLTNGALPLYLSRPFSRAEYTLGKFSVLAVLISLITWVPGMILFVMQGSLAGGGWMSGNLRIAFAIVTGAWAWILTVSLLALALSAWVRWRAVAGALLFGVFFAGAGVGGVFNEIMNTDWGAMMNLSVVIAGLWEWLFTGVVRTGVYPLPVWTAFASLGIVWVASLLMLYGKVRAYEVVR